MSRKIIQIAFSIFLLAGMAFSFAIKDGALANAPQAEPNGKIEGMLLDKFASEGSADFIVSFTEKADLSSAYKMDWDARGHFVYDTLTATAQHTQAKAKSILDGLGLHYQTFIAGNELYVWDGNLKAVNAVAALSEVSIISATRVYYIDPSVKSTNALLTAKWAGDLLANHAESTVAAPSSLDWGIVDTKADQFWGSFGAQGAGILVANIDTGVEWNHPALVDQFKCPGDPSNPACWSDPSNICGGSACDNNGHGTHTMGTMVGSDNPNLQYQVGMAPDAQWIACKGCETNSCSTYALNTCADWILAPGGDPGNRPDIVNNSWSGGSGDSWYLTKVQAWVADGIYPAFAAGNSGSSCATSNSPGDYQESFASAAHDSSRSIASFSSRGPSAFGDDPYTKPNISAPGVDVCSTVPGGGFECANWSGTSMASPHSAGAVALLWSCNPSLVGEVDQTFQILQDNADTPPDGNCGAPPDGEGNYTYGYGYLNILNAGSLWCGETGAIDGHVYEAFTDEPIESATVHAAGPFGGGLTANTDSSGYYTMTATVGTYTMTAVAPGFVIETIPGVLVVTDTVVTQDFNLVPQGTLNGYVTDFDNGFPLVGATVAASDGSSSTTNDLGYFEMFLDEGTYTVTASMQDYAPETAVVDIVSGESTQQDFALKAAIVFTPSPLHVTVDLYDTTNTEASILNRLPTDYAFEFQEKDESYIPLGGGTVNVEVKGTSITPTANTAVATGFQPRPDKTFTITRHNGINQANVLLLAADSDGDYGSPIQQLLLAYGDLGAVDYFDARYATPTLEQLQAYNVVVVWSDYMFADPAGIGNVLADYVDAGGKVIDMLWGIDPNWGYQGRFRTEGYSAMTTTGYNFYTLCLGTYDPNHPIMAGVTDVCDYFRAYGTNLTSGSSEVARWSDNELFVAVKDDGSVATINGYVGYVFMYTGQMPDVLHNAINWLAVPPDVPWLGEVPITGTVPASDTLPVTVYFTATAAVGINQPGDYLATLKVNGDPTVSVPVVMTVLPPDTWGKLDGTVTDLCTGDPIEEVLVDIPTGVPITQTMSDENGYYWVWLDQGTYDVNYSAPGYIAQDASLDVQPGETTTNDVQLVPDKACITVEPDLIEAWVLTDTQVYTTGGLTIGNLGPQDLNWEINEKDGGYITTTLSIPASDGNFSHGSEPSSTNRAPQVSGGDSSAALTFPLAGEPAYAVDVYPGSSLVYIPDTTVPGNWNIVAPEPGNQYFAGDFINGDFSTLYVIDFGFNSLFAVDTTTGAATLIGPTIPGSGESWTGMTGAPDGTMYASGSTCSTSTLYTVDISTGAATPIAPITNGACIIDIAINASGELYGVEIVNDQLIQIDPATGAGTVVGSLGIDANYAQGMDFEEETGILYWAAYTSQGELRIIDTTTGNSISVGAFPGGEEVDAFAFATGGNPVDVPWVLEEPVSGTVPPEGMQDVSIWFTSQYTDGTPMPLGIYFATLNIKSNDSVAGTKPVEVIMHIVEAFVAPSPEFDSNSPVNVGETMEFLNLTEDEGIPPANKYEWDFGDGITMTVGTKETVSHLYATFGTFTVSLTACNSEDLCGTITHNVTVLPKVMLLPLINKN